MTDSPTDGRTKVLSKFQDLRPDIVEAIFDKLSYAVFLYDKTLHIVGVNQSAARLLGMTAEGMMGKHCRELFRRGDCGTETSWLTSGMISVHIDQGGGRIAVVRIVQLFDDAGALEGMVGIVEDVTKEAAPLQRQIIAESPAMLTLLDFVRRIAVSEATSILIEGENGAGKDLIAQLLHHESSRSCGPFIAINCAAIPTTLLESELLGYEKGAFTDARSQKLGLFELANKGTLFLDEIGDLPHSLQVKLLRVLEDHSFRRLGGLRDITIDVRIIAATNQNLAKAVKEKTFRQDLYYRLNVIQLIVPPLRERPQDILPLARFFVRHYNGKFKRQIDRINLDAENLLLMHRWPGNVRELRNVIERAMILEDTAEIQPSSLPFGVPPPALSFAAAAGVDASLQAGYEQSLRSEEHRLLVEALRKMGGNKTRSAALLGITRDQLRYKMKKLKLP